MKFLIDTNVFIPLEPTTPTDLASLTPQAARFAQIASEGGHQLYVHPATLADIRRDDDRTRRGLRMVLFNKYPCLQNPPPISQRLESILGRAKPDTNDWVDNHLVAALRADAVDFLVTEDRRLRNKAGRLGLQDRVAAVAEAISVIQDLSDKAPLPPPAVQAIKAHALNESDPIFDSFREDYPNFDGWLRKCKREHRQAWRIIGGASRLAGFCIVKPEEAIDFGLSGNILKLCSFKVSKDYNGFRFGELLLKALFDYARSNEYDWIYVTVFEKHGSLISLLEDFGFEEVPERTERGELILTKPMSFTETDRERTEPLAFNIRYGPSCAKIKDVPTFVVPIKPEYHCLLFPEAEKQRELFPGQRPFGNSIRKAYLSHAVIRRISHGATLLFYRSADVRGVTCLGVVEGTLVSSSPNDIARHVGKRTVYNLARIRALCQEKEVLAILFRQAGILKDPISLDELMANGVVRGAPQSILAVPKEATEWLQERLGE